jgi:uncharacterized protein YmfQ (DUF2313 family)
MTTPTAADYLWQFQRLLPRGRIWHRGWGTLQAQDLLTLMPTWVRLHARAENLLVDAFPCTTVELMPEWEETLGLPDPCTGELPTLQQRQQAICAKFAARGGQSVQYFIDLAESLGYTVTIKQFAPFRAGINRAGDPAYSAEWGFAWAIIGPIATVTYFRADVSTAGEPLAAWGNELLECTIREYAPAHTIPIFEYPTESTWDVGESLWDDDQSVWDYVAPSVEAEKLDTLLMRVPASVRRSFLDLALREGVRPEVLLARLLERT